VAKIATIVIFAREPLIESNKALAKCFDSTQIHPFFDRCAHYKAIAASLSILGNNTQTRNGFTLKTDCPSTAEFVNIFFGTFRCSSVPLLIDFIVNDFQLLSSTVHYELMKTLTLSPFIFEGW
jgi:hypothetical protein